MINIRFGKLGQVKIEEPSRSELFALGAVFAFLAGLLTLWKLFF